MIKSFQQLFEESKMLEASLKDNPGIPGEGGRPGSYLDDVEKEAQRKNQDFQRRYGRDIPNFMGYVDQVRRMQKGHEKELEALAERGIRLFYGDILGETVLKIRFPKSDEIKRMAEKVPNEPSQIALKALEDEDIISRVHVRKIQNNITQGEAKNVKKILNLEEIFEGLVEIFGRDGAEKYRELLNKITDIAGFFDWQIPMEVQKEMWQRDKSGFSGSVSVSWEDSEDKKETENVAKDIVDKLIDDLDIPKEDAEELFDQIYPTINAIGTDFAMLLHETVKGIYELIISAAIPDDEETAGEVLMNTDSIADEIEDLRYGPEIAGDLRDFLNTFPESKTITNFRERVFGKLVALSKDDPKAFLEIIFKILHDDTGAQAAVKPFVDEVAEEMGAYQRAKTEYDLETGADVDSEEMEVEDEDYSTLSKKEIQALIDKALDDRDMEKVRELSVYLKESDQHKLYQKVLEVHGYHG